MQVFRRILFPNDLSQAAIAIVPYVREMALRFSAHVIVLNAFNPVPDYSLGPPPADLCESERKAMPYAPALVELRKQRLQSLEEFASTYLKGVACTTRVEDGDPAAAIEFDAQRESADLIMMPTRGLGKFRRLLLGSVTAKVLHDAPYPVFTSAHEPDPSLPTARGYRSILCAVDLNREADAVLDASSFLARTYRAKLTLVHMEPASSGKQGAQNAADSIKQKLDRLSSRTDPGEGRLQAEVRVASAELPEGIRCAAIEESADLVVLGRGHQTGDFSRMWSHLYTIIRRSPCPVLSV